MSKYIPKIWHVYVLTDACWTFIADLAEFTEQNRFKISTMIYLHLME